MNLHQFICLVWLAALRFSGGHGLGCHESQWQCDDGNCIPHKWRCDGDGDCLDGSDEMECAGVPACPPGQFPCIDTVGCVNASARCDGQRHCPTGSDEENCTAVDGCLDSDWTCRNHMCVPEELRCNRVNDCMDNSDEEACEVCAENSLQCPDGTCLSAEHRCDGHVHCSDGSDEPITCGRVCSVENGGCSHGCADESWGALCTCPVGYKLSSNGAICEDLNECAPPFSPCMHYCTNTMGSYYCHCREGFKLKGNSVCAATGNATRLLTVQGRSLGLLNVKTQQFEVIHTPVFDPVAVTFDFARGWYFWADSHGSIYKSYGQRSRTVYTGVPGIKGLAWDWLNGNLYWANRKTASIYMQAPDGNSYTTVLSKSISPSDLVLLPVESVMFWINAGPGDRVTIEKSWMDGKEMSTLAVLTAQAAHSLTACVAARRLFWVSNFKKSIETLKMDGTGHYSFTGLFNRMPPLSLAVFENSLYWVDDKGLWQIIQDRPNQRQFLWKDKLPLLSVYNELQQPQGPSACLKTPCQLCQLTKGNSLGFTCTCPNSKVLLLDGTCEYPRFLYAANSNINLLEFRDKESTQTQLFTTIDGILSFDLDWYRDWVYWVNQTGHVQRTSPTQMTTEVVPTVLPVCVIKVDQRSGSLYWMSCDQSSIGTNSAADGHSKQLYSTKKEVRDFTLDWLRGEILWMEANGLFSMSVMGGQVRELLQLAGGVRGNVAFDLRANSLLWSSKSTGLTTMSLLQERSHQAGARWNISGSVVAAFEPFLLSLSDDVMTLWDRRDGSPIQHVTVEGQVFGVIAALREIQTAARAPVCHEPSVLCRSSSVCLPPARLCDGKRDCPHGDDEEFCVITCPSIEDFMCKDRRTCVSRKVVCDGRAHCGDGSDEVNCPTVASPATRGRIPKCRTGLSLCADGTECVLHSHVCDGEEDCTDGSDELNCPGPSTPAPRPNVLLCNLGSKPCNDGRECVLYSHVCDGENDCMDGSDERGCPETCREGEFQCAHGKKCIPRAQVCDGKPDCQDRSDELDCWERTKSCHHRCADNKRCIPASFLCDGERDCVDGSDEVDCGPVSVPTTATPLITSTLVCTTPSVLCPGSSLCVSQTQLCDGHRDCPDGFDENNCVSRCKNRDEFLCNDRRKCIPRTQVCDGRAHCPDGSDEKRCRSTDPVPATSAVPGPRSPVTCRIGSKPCKDGLDCVLHSHVCDGEEDCRDGSDEVECGVTEQTKPPKRSNIASTVTSKTSPAATAKAQKCSVDSRRCRDGSACVPLRQICDGTRNCPDGSDEGDCDAVVLSEKHHINDSPAAIGLVTRPPVQQICTSPLLLCPGSSVCIHPIQLCNGKDDCPDGSDENCVKRCLYGTDFLCKDRRSCISREMVCDGTLQCHDGSDELNCPGPSTPAPRPNVLLCNLGSKPCNDGRECVLYSHVCDGENDCMDGSDERGCPETCREGEFQCAHGKKCIPRAQVCDGKPDCQDRSDELDCWERTKSCHHRCADNKRCIPASFLCDGERDCVDGSDEVDCGPVSVPTTATPLITSTLVCTTPSVLCPGSSLCVSQTQLCDGHRDCPDGFDENNCVSRCKNRDEFLCNDRRKCIPRTQVCDGRAHCPDGSDEKRCRSTDPVPATSAVPGPRSPVTCRIGSKPCKDGLDCVLHSHVCDGEEDCRDSSDEEGCAADCKEAEFQCSHGNRCIPRRQVCDGQYDCQDRSDEMDCSKPSHSCHQRCDNNTRCIPESFLCDGERDCTDGSDEEKCGLVACALNQYRCVSGQCVSEALRCDGYPDCSDHSDEADCTRPPRCPAQLRCPHSHECLQKEWLCDGEEDCKDGSDEKDCETPPAKCREYQWQCGDSSQCVPLSWRCDGKEDCHNGLDEDKCPERKCPSHLYQCGSGECVDPRLVCNGLINCADSSDEGAGCSQRNCSSPSAPHCDHQCVSTPSGPSCYCAAGFRLQTRSMSCVDIDECDASPHALCKHACLNTRGSYACHCHPGFYLEPDDKSCKTKDEPLLLASVQSELLLVGAHSNTLRLLSSASRPVFSLDYHWAQHRVYWLSPDYQSIRWADIKNSNNKGTLIKGVKSDFIAVDWIGQNLYWVDGLVGQILAVKLSDATVRSQDYAVVLGEDLEQPSSLVLLPHKGLMLWSEIGSSPQIERSGMDGSKRKVVVSRGLSWPVSLAFDMLDNRVYWADEKLRCIGSASLDGDSVKILQLVETPSPFSVAVFNDRVFWSDTKRRAIRSADKITGKDQKVLLKRPGQPFGLKVIHPLSQPAVSSPCDQLRCSHLCLLAPAVRRLTAVCRCPKGLLLAKDKATCSVPTESTFILLLSRATVYQIPLHSMQRNGVGLKKMPSSLALSLPGVTEASRLDVSIQDLSMYVADTAQGTVNVLKLSSSRSRKTLTPVGQALQLKDDSVTALAVDWVTSNLYWSSTQRPNLHVTSHRDGYTVSLLLGSLKGTTSIALYPPSGLLCYTAIAVAGGRSQAEVSCAWMDGRNKVVLWRKSSIPSSLVFSNKGAVVFWADTGEGVICSVGVDGSGYKQYKTGPGLLVSFTHTQNIILWATLDKDVTKLWFSDGLQPKQLWFETKTSIVEVRAYSNDSQSGTNGCSSTNGGCPQLCLPYPGGHTCKCGHGYYSVHVSSCDRLPDCPAGQESCSDGTKCISSSKFCDGQVDCPDQSDEQDCSNINSKASDGRSPPPSSTPQPKAQKNPVISVQDSTTACDLLDCSGHGVCLSDGGVSRCQCAAGYKGEFCQETEPGRSPAPVILSVFFIMAAVVAAVVIYAKRRGWTHVRSRSTEKETLMANMSLPCEHYEDTEELESPVDVKSPSLPLTALQL